MTFFWIDIQGFLEFFRIEISDGSGGILMTEVGCFMNYYFLHGFCLLKVPVNKTLTTPIFMPRFDLLIHLIMRVHC